MRRLLLRNAVATLAIASALVATAGPVLAQGADMPVVYQENFTDDNSGWLRYSRNEGAQPLKAGAGLLQYQAGYAKDGYFLYDNLPRDWHWSANDSVQRMKLTDESIEIDATKGHGDDASSSYGISCRLLGDMLVSSPATTSFYALEVTGDGRAGLARVNNGGWEYLVPMTRNTAVHQGNALNHLQLDCVGTTITGSVNGQQVASVEDEVLATGGVGVWAGTSDQPSQPGTGIVYNNVVVRAS